MAKIDEVKETIGYLKVVFGILIAINVSFIAWIYDNYDLFMLSEMISFTLLATAISLAIIYVNRTILSKIRSLGDL